MAKKPKMGVLVGTRNIFNSALATEARAELLKKLDGLGIESVILPADATPSSAIETREDAKKCAKLFQDNKDDLDGIIVSLPNFGDELGVIETLDKADLNLPILVQASDDDIGKFSLRERRDSFCGKLSVCNNLYQHGMPYTETTYHTCAIGSDVFTRDIQFFVDVCRVVNGLVGMRVGAIGARPGSFQTMRISEKLLQDSGITVVTVDLSEIIGAAERFDGKAKEITDKIAEIREYGRISKTIGDDLVLRQAKLSCAIDNWITENEVAAAGVQCWTSIQENYGCATCLSMSMLGNKLVPCACEVDVCGAIGMYALMLAGGNPSALLDWNNNYGEDRNMCINTHCSNFPKDFVGTDVEIGNLGVLGTVLGEENCFGAIKGKVASGPMTYFRVSTDDTEGMIRAYVGEGVFTDDPCDMDGGIAVCRVENLQGLMKFMCKNGFEHHVAMVRSHCADVLNEAIDNYMGWDLYVHE